MTRSELIDVFAERAGLSNHVAEGIVDCFFDSMTDAMLAGDRIEIRGFGNFEVREYGSYTGRNPKTGEPSQVAPKKLPFFKVGKELKQLVLDGQA